MLAKLQELDLAARLAGWLRHPANAEAVGRQLTGIAHFGLAALHDERVRAFVEAKVIGRVRKFDLAPPLAQALRVLTGQGRHQAMLDELLLRLDSIMQDEDTRTLVADAISREIRTLRYLGLSRPVSGWSANKFVDGLSALIAEIAADPEHLIRQRFDEHVGEYIERLEQSGPLVLPTLRKLGLSAQELAEMQVQAFRWANSISEVA